MSIDPDEHADDIPDVDPRLEFEYPCEWRYRVIGPDPERLHAAIVAAVGEASHEVSAGNVSRTGRYVSLEVAVTVTSDADRRRLFAALAEHEDVRFVL